MELRRYLYHGVIACVLSIGLLGTGLAGANRAAAASGGPLVLVGPGGGALYVVRPRSRTIRVLRRNDGKTVATQQVAAFPTALALDSTRDLLYAALDGGGIAVLSGRSLRPLLTLHTPATTGALAPVPGYNALYLADAVTGRILYLSYTRQGAIHLSTPYTATGAPVPGLHVVLDSPSSRSSGGTFWAAGFTAGEAVALSVGAKADGTLRADSSGVVSGALPPHAGVGRGPGSLGLYGLSSGVSLVGLIKMLLANPPLRVSDASNCVWSRVAATCQEGSIEVRQQHLINPAHHIHAGTRRAAVPPPLYLSIIPGPLVTVTPPLAHGAVRVPLASSGLVALPLLLVIALVKRRRRRAKRRRARSTTSTAPRRVRVT